MEEPSAGSILKRENKKNKSPTKKRSGTRGRSSSTGKEGNVKLNGSGSGGSGRKRSRSRQGSPSKSGRKSGGEKSRGSSRKKSSDSKGIISGSKRKSRDGGGGSRRKSSNISSHKSGTETSSRKHGKSRSSSMLVGGADNGSGGTGKKRKASGLSKRKSNASTLTKSSTKTIRSPAADLPSSYDEDTAANTAKNAKPQLEDFLTSASSQGVPNSIDLDSSDDSDNDADYTTGDTNTTGWSENWTDGHIRTDLMTGGPQPNRLPQGQGAPAVVRFYLPGTVVKKTVDWFFEKAHTSSDGSRSVLELGDMFFEPEPNASQFEYNLVPGGSKSTVGALSEEAIGVHSGEWVTDRYVVYRSGTVWPKGVVRYIIPAEFMRDEQDVIRAAIGEINVKLKNHIWFVEGMGKEKTYLKFKRTKDTNASYIGRIKSPVAQLINLSIDCTKGTVLRLLLHSLGLPNTLHREDRDFHATIQWDNVIKGESNPCFYKLLGAPIENIDYDFSSVLHDDFHLHAINKRKPTIVPMDPIESTPGQPKPGRAYELSAKDVKTLKKLYPYQETSPIKTTVARPGSAATNGSRTTLGIGDASIRSSTSTINSKADARTKGNNCLIM